MAKVVHDPEARPLRYLTATEEAARHARWWIRYLMEARPKTQQASRKISSIKRVRL